MQPLTVDEHFATVATAEAAAAAVQPHVHCEGGSRAEEPVAHTTYELGL